MSRLASYIRRFVLNTTFNEQPGQMVASETGCDSLLLLAYAHLLILSLGICFKFALVFGVRSKGRSDCTYAATHVATHESSNRISVLLISAGCQPRLGRNGKAMPACCLHVTPRLKSAQVSNWPSFRASVCGRVAGFVLFDRNY